jgi:hypothetical protein
MKAWIKGGLIVMGMGAVLFLIIVFYSLIFIAGERGDLSGSLQVLLEIILWPIQSLNQYTSGSSMPLLLGVMSGLLAFIKLFIIGAIIGLIISKFKPNKKQK